MNDLVKRKHLIIGADPFPPYQYYDSTGILRGTDYERIKIAGEKAGFELEFLIEDWMLIEQKFSQKKLDAVFQLPKTPEREGQYLFSKLLRNGITEVITGHPTLDILSINDIEKQKYTLGVVEGISYGEEVQSLSPESKTTCSNNEDLLVAIGKNEIDFGIFDRGVKEFLAEKLSIKNIRVINALTFIRPLFMAFHDEEIKTVFDKYL
jgi:polar amino acid transport system substrate-binding protein